MALRVVRLVADALAAAVRAEAVGLRQYSLDGVLLGVVGRPRAALQRPPAAVGVGSSTLVLLWVVLGGRGTLVGPIVGAVVLSYLTARLSGTLLETWLVVVGVILVVVIVLIPAGIFGFLKRERTS